jgi:S-DNA-T family DNA segregation ATPase FtsK/SpoIIIE
MRKAAVRNIAAFNSEVQANRLTVEQLEGETPITLPYIVVVIDELCDLMMTAPRDIEDSIQRLAQKARAAGIHLILATQRPSVDVITGVIKANLPCRISFQVASKHDSRTIIESIGAERLLGRGDMLFLPPGTNRIIRGHGAYIGDREINQLSDRLRQLYPTRYDNETMAAVQRNAQQISQKNDGTKGDKIDEMGVDGTQLDENDLYDRAIDFAVSSGTVSTSSLQRNFRIGYNKAARLMDRMVKDGLVGPSDVAGKPRQVISTERGVHT